MCPDKYSFFVKLQFTAVSRVLESFVISVKETNKNTEVEIGILYPLG